MCRVKAIIVFMSLCEMLFNLNVVDFLFFRVHAGAIYQSGSNLMISGITTFVENAAATGGKKV